jgi:menaquinone-9 beta-reductase
LKDIIILGGGISGLIHANILADAGLDVLVIEKKSYPFHRVCGEYISNEALPFLKSNNLFPEELQPTHINQLILTTEGGKTLAEYLHLGGFGISRYSLDNFLYEQAKGKKADFSLNTTVTGVQFDNNRFIVSTHDGREVEGRYVIGCFGKRSNLDRHLSRKFFYNRSPFVGIKYHITLPDYPSNLISLHTFEGGYCGVAPIEDGKACLCYLTEKRHLKDHGNIQMMEERVLWKNPFLKDVFNKANFLYDKPEVINEISFERKSVVEDHILMSGDAAGMITPLCGNGMAMAIHATKILSALIITAFKEDKDRAWLEKHYEKQWNNLFNLRLQAGRKLQNLLKHPQLANIAVQMIKSIPGVAPWVIKQTHGKPF